MCSAGRRCGRWRWRRGTTSLPVRSRFQKKPLIHWKDHWRLTRHLRLATTLYHPRLVPVMPFRTGQSESIPETQSLMSLTFWSHVYTTIEHNEQYFSVTSAHVKQVQVRFKHEIKQHTTKHNLDQPWGSETRSDGSHGISLCGLQPQRSEGDGAYGISLSGSATEIQLILDPWCCIGAHGKSLSGPATEIWGRWSPRDILIWIAATEIRGWWLPWEILFTRDYGLDPMEKLMWNHTREISIWFLQRKSARQRTNVAREWPNGTDCSDYLHFQPSKRKFSNGKEATAEIILKKQKELKEQRMECSSLECCL